ncbi:MAG: diacylglycerol kinase family protein [Saprospiraceae bacterium]
MLYFLLRYGMEQPFWYIIANPTSGGGALRKQWPVVEQLLQDLGFSYTIQFTEYPGHATRLAEDAILKGQRNLLGMGGDGTNHEIVNGILGQSFVPSADITYALLPVGTGNDWARSYELSKDPRRRLQQIMQGKTVFQDAGLVTYFRDGQAGRRYFANVAGLAYDGYLGQKMTRHPVTKPWQYLLLVAKYLLQYRLRKARIYYDDQQVADFFYTINVGICRYSGGGMQLVPQAIPDDGLFALTFARRLPKLEVLMQTRRFYNGSLLKHPKVEGHQARSIRVEAEGDTLTLLEADGEFLGETPVVFTLLEKALRIVV